MANTPISTDGGSSSGSDYLQSTYYDPTQASQGGITGGTPYVTASSYLTRGQQAMKKLLQALHPGQSNAPSNPGGYPY